MIRFLTASGALAFAAAPAFAHPGHLAGTGFGHSHYVDAALIAGAGLAAAGWSLAALYRRLARLVRV